MKMVEGKVVRKVSPYPSVISIKLFIKEGEIVFRYVPLFEFQVYGLMVVANVM